MNNLSNEDLLNVIKVSGSHLNLMTISKYARAEGMSYNGVKNHRNIVNVFGAKMVIDNE